MWPYLQIGLWTSKPYACSQQTFLILRCIVVVDIDGQLQVSKQASYQNSAQHVYQSRFLVNTVRTWHIFIYISSSSFVVVVVVVVVVVAVVVILYLNSGYKSRNFGHYKMSVDYY